LIVRSVIPIMARMLVRRTANTYQVRNFPVT